MADRPVKRKVTIVLAGRDPNDLTRLLKAVADGLRPNEVEIRFPADASDPGAPTVANEPLETQAREQVERDLDRKDRQIREAAASGKVPTASTDPLPSKLKRVGSFVSRLASNGWRVAPKVLELVKGGADLYGKFFDS